MKQANNGTSAKSATSSPVHCKVCGRAVRAKLARDGTTLGPVRHKDRRTGERCEAGRPPVPTAPPSGTLMRGTDWPRVECPICGRAVRAKLARGGSVLRPLRHKDQRTGQRCEARRDLGPPPAVSGTPIAAIKTLPAKASDLPAALVVHGSVEADLALLPPEARAPLGGAEESERLHTIAAQAGKRTYRVQWGLYRHWCADVGLRPLPSHPDLLRVYAMHLGTMGRKCGAISVALYAIVAAHEACKLVAEPFLAVHRGLCRLLTPKPSPSITGDELRTILATCDSNAMGGRDRAMLLAAYHGRLRSCRLVGLNMADLQREPDAYCVQIRATGKAVRLPRLEDPDLCPVLALDRWLAILADVRPEGPNAEEPLFMALHPQRGRDAMVGARLGAGEVARVVKRHAAAAQLDARRYRASALRVAKPASAVPPRTVRAA